LATVFAPTNDAFTALAKNMGYTQAQLLALPSLKSILLYHVVPGVAAQVGSFLLPCFVSSWGVAYLLRTSNWKKNCLVMLCMTGCELKSRCGPGGLHQHNCDACLAYTLSEIHLGGFIVGAALLMLCDAMCCAVQ
jgi:hypothetical protein